MKVLMNINGEMELNDKENKGLWCWTPPSTKMFLSLYLERKAKFRDPKYKKKNLWTEIVKGMETNGYTGVTEEVIDRKMRNMKKTYKSIKENNRSTGRGRVGWEYYDTFEEIFDHDITINGCSTISSFPATEEMDLHEYFDVLNASMLPPTISMLQPSLPMDYPSDSVLQPTEVAEVNISSNSKNADNKSEKARKGRDIYKQRNKMLEAERKKTQALEDLTNKIKESNEIQRERNEILRAFLPKDV